MRRLSAFLGALAWFVLTGTGQAQYYPYPQAYNYGYTQTPYNYPRPYYPQQAYTPPNYNYGYNNAYRSPQYQAPQYTAPAYSYPPPYTSYYGNQPAAQVQAQPQPLMFQPMPSQPVAPSRPTTIVPGAPVSLPAPPPPKGSIVTANPTNIPEKVTVSPDGDAVPKLDLPDNGVTKEEPTLPAPEPVPPGKKVLGPELFPGPYGGGVDGSCTSCPAKGGFCEKDTCGQGHCHFYGEAGFLFLQPRWQGNVAFVNGNPGAVNNAVNQQDFRYAWSFTPQVALGIVGSGGLGARVRWYMFDQTNVQTTGVAQPGQTIGSASPLGIFNVLAPGENAQASSRLFLHAADFEGTQDVMLGSTLLRLAGGARYVYLQQNYNEQQFLAVAPTSTLSSFQHFNGVGPTVALDGLRQIGTTGFGVYGRGRGAVLFGSNPQDVGGNLAGVPVSGARPHEDTLPILELEAGVQYTKNIGRTLLFARIGGAAFTYFGVGNSSNSSPSINGSTLAITPEAQGRQNLSLLGLSFMAGIYY